MGLIKLVPPGRGEMPTKLDLFLISYKTYVTDKD